MQSVPSLSEKISLSAAIFSSDEINLYSSTNNVSELADNAKPERSPDFFLTQFVIDLSIEFVKYKLRSIW